MKIAIFTDLFEPWGSGGIVTSIKAQKAELEKAGHEVTIFCPGFKSQDRTIVTVPSHQKIKIEQTVLAKRPTVVEKFVLAQFPNFGEFDLVHVHYEASCSIAGVRLARRFGVPLVQTMHGREDQAIAVNVPHPLKNLVAGMLCFLHGCYLPNVIKVRRDAKNANTFAKRKMWTLMVNHAQHANVVITPAEHFAKKLRHYGVTKQIMIVSNGIPDKIVEQKFAVREFADGEVLKMLWNARLSKEKRILQFLQALKLLKRPYVLYLYGNGNMSKRAERYAKRHNLKVKFFGAVPREEIIKRMQEAHLSVLASYNFDVQPMTMLEAEATGLPTFFCDPDLKSIMPVGGFVYAKQPSAEVMAQTLDAIKASEIKTMSQVMLKARPQVAQSAQLRDLAYAYREALSFRVEPSKKKASKVAAKMVEKAKKPKNSHKS